MCKGAGERVGRAPSSLLPQEQGQHTIMHFETSRRFERVIIRDKVKKTHTGVSPGQLTKSSLIFEINELS